MIDLSKLSAFMLALIPVAMLGCAIDGGDDDELLSAEVDDLSNRAGTALLRNQATLTCLAPGAGPSLRLTACDRADLQQHSLLVGPPILFRCGTAYCPGARVTIGSNTGKCLSPTTGGTVACATLPARTGYFWGGFGGPLTGRLQGISDAGKSTKCIDVANGQVVLAPCNSSTSQLWAQISVYW